MSSSILHSDAALRAAERARSARLRLERLRRREPVTLADVARAREALRDARARALAASVRHAMAAGSGTPTRPSADLLYAADSARPIAALLGTGAAEPADVFTAYVALGGACTFFEVDGFLHGITPLPRFDVALLEQAFDELT